MPGSNVPEVTVERLSIYLRALRKIPDERILSSHEFAKLVGTTDAQIRRDLSYFGGFGIPSQGYRIDKLKQEIIHILGLDRKRSLALVGVGKLGSALLGYPGFRKDEFQIKLAFDNDPEKIGKAVGKIIIQDIKKILELLPRHKVKIGIITTSAQAAQDTADKLVEGKVEGILNFTPACCLAIPDKIKLKNVDLSILVETLSFLVS